MPFLHILWNAERMTQEAIIRTRDAAVRAVGEVLCAFDEAHVVNEAMIDVRTQEIGPLDRIRSDVFVTLCARHEDARERHADKIVSTLAAVVSDASGVPDAVVELVLTKHSSTVDYAALE